MTDTEAAADRYRDADLWPPMETVQAMFEAQSRAFIAVGGILAALTEAAEAAAGRLRQGQGRLVFAGAGASARLAVQDGVELVPTFGWDPERLAYLIAGGPAALLRSIEGAEDDAAAGRSEAQALNLGASDVVIAVAASGTTAYTRSVQATAGASGALTVAFANNPAAPLLESADHPLLLATGAEFLPGSTRMVAGTAQKIALNLLSTRIMMALGRVYRGRMVGVRTTNAKLRERARSMVADLADCPPESAAAALDEAGYDVRLALLILAGLDAEAARATLVKAGGDVRVALAGC